MAFIIKLIKKVKKLLCKVISYLYTKQFFRTLRGDKHYLVCSRGIGDTILFLSRLKEYNERYHSKVNLIAPSNQAILLNAYNEYIDEIILLSSKKILYLATTIWETNTFNPKLQFILPPKAVEQLQQNKSLFDLFGMTLKISGKAFQRPNFKIDKKRKTILFEKLQITEGNYIILAYESVTVPPVDDAVWEIITQFYKKEGFIVLENIAPGKKLKYGDKSIYLELDEMYELSRYAGLIVSARSGLSDLLAFTETPLMIVYPNAYYRRIYSFSNMPFAKHVREIESNQILKNENIEIYNLYS